MNTKQRKQSHVCDTLEILVALVLLVFINRLWPILLLVILGVFVAALRLAFLSGREDETESHPREQRRKAEQIGPDQRYAAIIQQVAGLVRHDYPDARWVWESPRAKEHIGAGENVYILLDHAGGFRKAEVQIRDMCAVSLKYETEEPAREEHAHTTQTHFAEESEQVQPEDEPIQEDYSLLAFEWVESNIIDCNRRCNDAIGHGVADVMLTAEELPRKKSWGEICEQLKREGLRDVEITPSGIRIHLMK